MPTDDEGEIYGDTPSNKPVTDVRRLKGMFEMSKSPPGVALKKGFVSTKNEINGRQSKPPAALQLKAGPITAQKTPPNVPTKGGNSPTKPTPPTPVKVSPRTQKPSPEVPSSSGPPGNQSHVPSSSGPPGNQSHAANHKEIRSQVSNSIFHQSERNGYGAVNKPSLAQAIRESKTDTLYPKFRPRDRGSSSSSSSGNSKSPDLPAPRNNKGPDYAYPELRGKAGAQSRGMKYRKIDFVIPQGTAPKKPPKPQGAPRTFQKDMFRNGTGNHVTSSSPAQRPVSDAGSVYEDVSAFQELREKLENQKNGVCSYEDDYEDDIYENIPAET